MGERAASYVISFALQPHNLRQHLHALREGKRASPTGLGVLHAFLKRSNESNVATSGESSRPDSMDVPPPIVDDNDDDDDETMSVSSEVALSPNDHNESDMDWLSYQKKKRNKLHSMFLDLALSVIIEMNYSIWSTDELIEGSREQLAERMIDLAQLFHTRDPNEVLQNEDNIARLKRITFEPIDLYRYIIRSWTESPRSASIITQPHRHLHNVVDISIEWLIRESHSALLLTKLFVAYELGLCFMLQGQDKYGRAKAVFVQAVNYFNQIQGENDEFNVFEWQRRSDDEPYLNQSILNGCLALCCGEHSTIDPVQKSFGSRTLIDHYVRNGLICRAPYWRITIELLLSDSALPKPQLTSAYRSWIADHPSLIPCAKSQFQLCLLVHRILFSEHEDNSIVLASIPRLGRIFADSDIDTIQQAAQSHGLMSIRLEMFFAKLRMEKYPVIPNVINVDYSLLGVSLDKDVESELGLFAKHNQEHGMDTKNDARISTIDRIQLLDEARLKVLFHLSQRNFEMCMNWFVLALRRDTLLQSYDDSNFLQNGIMACINVGAHVEAAILCQFLADLDVDCEITNEISPSTAIAYGFDVLQKANPDMICSSTYAPFFWYPTLVEALIDLFDRAGDLSKKAKALEAMQSTMTSAVEIAIASQRLSISSSIDGATLTLLSQYQASKRAIMHEFTASLFRDRRWGYFHPSKSS